MEGIRDCPSWSNWLWVDALLNDWHRLGICRSMEMNDKTENEDPAAAKLREREELERKLVDPLASEPLSSLVEAYAGRRGYRDERARALLEELALSACAGGHGREAIDMLAKVVQWRDERGRQLMMEMLGPSALDPLTRGRLIRALTDGNGWLDEETRALLLELASDPASPKQVRFTSIQALARRPEWQDERTDELVRRVIVESDDWEMRRMAVHLIPHAPGLRSAAMRAVFEQVLKGEIAKEEQEAAFESLRQCPEWLDARMRALLEDLVVASFTSFGLCPIMTLVQVPAWRDEALRALLFRLLTEGKYVHAILNGLEALKSMPDWQDEAMLGAVRRLAEAHWFKDLREAAAAALAEMPQGGSGGRP